MIEIIMGILIGICLAVGGYFAWFLWALSQCDKEDEKERQKRWPNVVETHSVFSDELEVGIKNLERQGKLLKKTCRVDNE